jgi:hypothetical protein
MIRMRRGIALGRNSRSEKPVSFLHSRPDLLYGLVFLPVEPLDFLSMGLPGFSGGPSREARRHERSNPLGHEGEKFEYGHVRI